MTENKNSTLLTALSALIGTGALLGLSTNLAKVAAVQQVAALPFLMWSLFGAAIILLTLSFYKKRKLPINKVTIKYYFLSALFSVAGSNLIFFSAIPHVGVSFVALAISLPPLLTYLIALFIGMEKLCLWRTIGVFFSLAGTAILVTAKWQTAETNHLWIVIALTGPVLLSIGNIYRTTHWPIGAKPESLAPGMLIAAFCSLFMAGIIIPTWSIEFVINGDNMALIAIQSIVFSGQFLLLFVLQKAGGPVFLSLIGAVAAIFGIPFAVIILGEELVPAVLPSAGLITVGILFMIKQQLAIVKAQNALSRVTK